MYTRWNQSESLDYWNKHARLVSVADDPPQINRSSHIDSEPLREKATN